MASRKKDPAALRTISLFSGKTTLEEAEHELVEEAPEQRSNNPLVMVERSEETAIRWLGLDVFHEGDDVKVAVHPKGHAVLLIVRTDKGGPFHTASIKLSKVQWSKLKALAREDG